MARADDQSSNSKMHTQAEVATSRRRTAGKSEAYVAPLWPCKINGCGKKFVREADLKRHQRTTKTHSMPSFTCQECDASFTRTDALRRHQKSRHHVVRALSRSTNAFIEESGTTSGETKAPSTSSSRSTRSRSSRSLSPRLSQERAKERSERERRERELPPLETTGPSRYYRQHTATSSPYPPPATPPQSAPVSRPQTHSSSLNAILASPISTPRLHPVNWSYPSPSGQRTTHDGYTAPPPPQPPPSVQSNGHYAPHYRYPAAPDMVPPILGPIHPPLSHRPANLDLKHTRRQNPYPTISTSSTSPSTRETSETSFIPTPSPPPPPPIASTGPVPLSASSYDSDDSESEAEVDELLPSSPEPETETDSSHRIPDIEACIDPATGITAEEVKAAMDAVLKSVQQQELEKEEQQQQQVDGECVVDAHGRAVGVGLRASSTADHDGSLFLSEMVSSTRGANGNGHAHPHGHSVHTRHGTGSHGPVHLPGARRDLGRGMQGDCHSPSPLGDPNLHHGEDEGGVSVGIGARTPDMDGSGSFKSYTAAAAAAAGGGGGRLGKVKVVNGINGLHDNDGDHDDDGYSRPPPPLDRSPSPLEHHHIIHEDGEHMLHSAELLTQESLATPPP